MLYMSVYSSKLGSPVLHIRRKLYGKIIHSVLSSTLEPHGNLGILLELQNREPHSSSHVVLTVVVCLLCLFCLTQLANTALCLSPRLPRHGGVHPSNSSLLVIPSWSTWVSSPLIKTLERQTLFTTKH